MKSYVCIMGGANVDVSATPYSILRKGDSIPGKSKISFGGVGRNVAENLSRLGVKVKFITAIGDDPNSKNFEHDCQLKNIDLSSTLKIPDTEMSTYVCINDPSGEMQWAVSSMDIYENLTAKYLAEHIDQINSSKVCVLDTNLPEDAIQYVAENCKVPLFVDTVSVSKAEKLKGCLDKIHTLKPNLLEAELLTGMKINSDEDIEKCAMTLLESGVQNVYLSLGERGVFCANKSQCALVPPYTGLHIVNTTGAGDSFLAGLVYSSIIKGFDIVKSAKIGLAASALCVSSPECVSKKMSYKGLMQMLMLRNEEENYEF